MSMNKGNIVVTGATSGIGKALCVYLAEQGWHVYVSGRDPKKIGRVISQRDGKSAGSLTPLIMDVDDLSSIRQAIAEIGQHEIIYGWVNNAGISNISPFLDIDEATYDRIQRTNLKGSFFAMQFIARYMVQNHVKGSIVNIASMASKQGAAPFLADYAASKFGILGATQAAAYELGSYGIRVNAVCPGYIQTNMQNLEEKAESRITDEPVNAIHQRFIGQTPLGRIGDPLDVAKTVAFLLSQDAGFLTGEAIAVNGGAYMD